jgi:SAM-dependent methyltransferase
MLDDFDDPSEFVAAGYDLASERYTEAAKAGNEVRDRYTRAIVERVEAGSDVLDLGCGAGQPTTEILAEHFRVTGVEVSGSQIARARETIPGARFIQGDMCQVEHPESSFDGVVAFYSVIHVPRQRQQALLDSIYQWLRPNGLFIASMASTGSERWVEEDFFGAPMYWSSFDADTNEQMIRDAGFEIESADLVTLEFDEEEETHLWVVARRPE